MLKYNITTFPRPVDVPSFKLIQDFNLMLFFKFHIIKLLETESLYIKLIVSFSLTSDKGYYPSHLFLKTECLVYLPSPIQQDMINLIVSVPIRRSPNAFMNAAIREHCTLDRFLMLHVLSPLLHLNLLTKSSRDTKGSDQVET
jgi:hypothetical protein